MHHKSLFGNINIFWIVQVAVHQDPRDACSAIAAESYKLWLEHENRTDDITIIIVHIRDAQNVRAQILNFVGITLRLLLACRDSFFFPKFTQSGHAGSDKANCSSTGAAIALHTVQSELPVFVPSEANHLNGALHTVQSELPVFVPSEANHLNGDTAPELHPSSFGSTERRLSCVAPSPTHPLYEGGKASEASRPTHIDSAVSRPVEAWHSREGGNELEQPLQLQRPLSC